MVLALPRPLNTAEFWSAYRPSNCNFCSVVILIYSTLVDFTWIIWYKIFSTVHKTFLVLISYCIFSDNILKEGGENSLLIPLNYCGRTRIITRPDFFLNSTEREFSISNEPSKTEDKEWRTVRSRPTIFLSLEQWRGFNNLGTIFLPRNGGWHLHCTNIAGL